MALAQTTLAAAIATTVATSCSVRDVLGFAASSETDDVVLVDSEIMLVAGGLGTTSWTSITRGHGGSTAATHADGATVTRIERGWTDLVDFKGWADITSEVDDADTLVAIDATNAYLTHVVGMFLGPSTDTTRTYRRLQPADDGRTLWVPGGIRSFTTLELRRRSTDTWETVTSGDVVVGPPAWELRSGQPYAWVEFIDDPAGTWSAFPLGGEARFTGAAFGSAAVEATGASIARTCVTRMLNARNEGSLANPTPSKFVFPDDRAILEALRAEQYAGVS